MTSTFNRLPRPLWLALGLAISILFLVTCGDDSTCPDNSQPDLEVHDWGVMVGCASDTSFFLTSRPEVSTLVRIPVIYIHSKNRTPFTTKVTFASGRPTATYPEAVVSGATATWAKADLLAACEAQGIPAGPINQLSRARSLDNLVRFARQQAGAGQHGIVGLHVVVVALA